MTLVYVLLSDYTYRDYYNGLLLSNAYITTRSYGIYCPKFEDHAVQVCHDRMFGEF